MTDAAGLDADLEGPLSPPRQNGEIVFASPWERRLFGVTIAMCRAGRCDWEAFRQRLIQRIAEDETRPYWQSWAAAFEDVLAHSSMVTRGELDERHLAMLNRPVGHDHHH
jgi:nitrile hydratase accessory protein